MKFEKNAAPLPCSVSGETDETLDFAMEELLRMTNKAGIRLAAPKPTAQTSEDFFILEIGTPRTSANAPAELAGKITHDGYAIDIGDKFVRLTALSSKGILNAVYDLMERLGYIYLAPGDDGEWAPESPLQLPVGLTIRNPRFPRRGVFREVTTAHPCHTSEEWFAFFAKLRFNAVVLDELELLPLARKLGLRMEIGGHGFSKLLPRELFDECPELFRMFQPEDFNGRRMPDSNLCVTNPESRRIVADNFRAKLAEADDAGAYAMHLWPDDLPAGGWCLCPSCRAFEPADQAAMAMRLLADAAKSAGSAMRIPFLAYHDTMRPGPEISMSPNMFLLFAPRERCYGHALDDPGCKRNSFYLAALDEWMEKFTGIADNHTFEYYFDQILFRGMHPYLPEVVIEDMRVYQERGIDCHMSLQVAADSAAPEYNMLVFAEAHWDESLTSDQFAANLAEKMNAAGHAENGVLERCLNERAATFADAMRMCDHNLNIYLDYRWLPETTSPFGAEMADSYAVASAKLADLAEELKKAGLVNPTTQAGKLMTAEAKRTAFEAAELKAMSHQQRGVNNLAIHRDTGSESARIAGSAELRKAVAALETSMEKAIECGFETEDWYTRNINAWLTREFKAKA